MILYFEQKLAFTSLMFKRLKAVFVAALFSNVETTEVPINRLMNKQNMVYTYSGIFSLTKE